MKRLLILGCLLIFISTSAFGDMKKGQTGGVVGADLEMGNTPFSMDGGTNGLVFDVDNAGTNNILFSSGGNVTIPGTLTVNLTESLAGNFGMGTSVADGGTITIQDGAQTGDDTVVLEMSGD